MPDELDDPGQDGKKNDGEDYKSKILFYERNVSEEITAEHK